MEQAQNIGTPVTVMYEDMNIRSGFVKEMDEGVNNVVVETGRAGGTEERRVSVGGITFDIGRHFEHAPAGQPPKDYAQVDENKKRKDAALPEPPHQVMITRYIGHHGFNWAANGSGGEFNVEDLDEDNYDERLKLTVGESFYQKVVRDGLDDNTLQRKLESFMPHELVALFRLKFFLYGSGKTKTEHKKKQKLFMKLPWPIGQGDAPGDMTFEGATDLKGCKLEQWQEELLSNRNLTVAFYFANILKDWNSSRLVFASNSEGTANDGHHLLLKKSSSDTNVDQLSNHLNVSTKGMSYGRLAAWASVALDPNPKKWDNCIKYFSSVNAKREQGILDAHGCHRQCDRTKDLELPGGAKISAASCVALQHVFPGDSVVNTQNKLCKGKIGLITTFKDKDGKKKCRVFSPKQLCRCTEYPGNPGEYDCTKIFWTICEQSDAEECPVIEENEEQPQQQAAGRRSGKPKTEEGTATGTATAAAANDGNGESSSRYTTRSIVRERKKHKR